MNALSSHQRPLEIGGVVFHTITKTNSFEVVTSNVFFSNVNLGYYFDAFHLPKGTTRTNLNFPAICSIYQV